MAAPVFKLPPARAFQPATGRRLGSSLHHHHGRLLQLKLTKFHLLCKPQLVCGSRQVSILPLLVSSSLVTRCDGDVDDDAEIRAIGPSCGVTYGGGGATIESLPKWSSVVRFGFLSAVPLIVGAFCGTAIAGAAEHSIGTSSLGLKVASYLRGSGWCDEAIVAFIASLPILELRGAIPVGYWMQLHPVKTYMLAVVGNMVPVPFVALYLERVFNYVASRSEGGKKWVDRIINNTRRKAEPIHEFQWIGLTLFVAVPFPGTGAWTGAFAASILGMTFWEAVSANLVGVLLAGLLVNLVVSVGLREAVFVGVALFVLSTFMWRILRFIYKNKASEA